MKKIMIFMFWFFLLLSCNDNSGKIYKTCIANKPCIIQNSNIIILDNSDEFDPIYTIGNCSIGKTYCETAFAETECNNFQGPTEELCDDLDNDCNGQIDEGFDEDHDGFKTCDGDCNDNNPTIYPGSTENCDGIDNDCDDIIDNIVIECWDGNRDAVFGENSFCQKGQKTCINGQWGSCKNQRFPTSEICDGIDNDCDGVIDSDIIKSCGPESDIGQCSKGDIICVGNDEVCINASYPEVEKCDNIDNNCDGQIDEELIRLCQTNCGYGEETCQAGHWINCTARQPIEEICDGIDNDCDGQIDEDCPCQSGEFQSCREPNMLDRSTGELRSCGLGVKYCLQGNWGACEFFTEEPEICDNWDNNCDDIIDQISDICGSNPNLDGIGQCLLGSKECSLGVWSECQGDIPPELEICDGIDNDCNGQVDEGLTPHQKVDMLFVIDGSASMCNKITEIANAISTYSSDFIGTNHRFGLVTFPGSSAVSNPRIIANKIIDINDINIFINSLSMINCNLPGDENILDTLNTLTDPIIAINENLQISWRSDAYPYIIIISDEPPYAWDSNLNISLVSNRLQNCAVGSCIGNDMYEVYAIVPSIMYIDWEPLVFYDQNRFVDLLPIDANHYVNGLRNIFKNVCF